MISDTILDAIGHTPLVRLHRMVEPGSAEVLVKFEALNVGGSIKTRTAWNMICDAEAKGLIGPGSALETARDLARREGLLAGISSGTNVYAALQLARKLGPGKTVATVLPDTAERYFSTPLFAGD